MKSEIYRLTWRAAREGGKNVHSLAPWPEMEDRGNLFPLALWLIPSKNEGTIDHQG